MFQALEKIHERPQPFAYDTAVDLWNDEHTSARMLSFHLDEASDIASRNAAFIHRSVEWIASAFKVGKGSAIADFGCGPGWYTTLLARRGARVTGIDFSERSIAYARKTAARERLPIRYVKQNYLDFETEDRFDLVLMIMCDFCALSPAKRKGILRKFQRILKPGGSVLMDVYSLSAFEQVKEEAICEVNLLDGFWSPNPYYGFRNTFKYKQEKVAVDKYTIVEAERTRTVYNWLQYFAPEDLAREITEAGLTPAALYADVAGTPHHPAATEFAVIAGKA